MKHILILALLCCFSFAQAYEITVYGRNSCGFTANLRNDLTTAGVTYSYCNIDSAKCLGAMFQVAIEFNLAPSGTVNLPVVLVVTDKKRYGYVRPSLNDILKVTAIDDVKAIPDVYPNPADDIIHVSDDSEIYDLRGLKLIESHDRNIMIEGLKPGVYILKVRNKVIKFIKQ